jgi:hypothetical protein
MMFVVQLRSYYQLALAQSPTILLHSLKHNMRLHLSSCVEIISIQLSMFLLHISCEYSLKLWIFIASGDRNISKTVHKAKYVSNSNSNCGAYLNYAHDEAWASSYFT